MAHKRSCLLRKQHIHSKALSVDKYWNIEIKKKHTSFNASFYGSVFQNKKKKNKNAEASKYIQSFIWWISLNGHLISLINKSQMYELASFLSLADQIWPYLQFSKLSKQLPVLAAIFDFWRKRLFYEYFDKKLHCICLFSHKGDQMVKLFVSIFASLPVLAAILIFSILTVFYRKLISKWI